MKISKNNLGKLSAAAVMSLAFSFPTTAHHDERFEDYEPRLLHHDGAYPEARPFRVYVNIRSTGHAERYEGRRDHRGGRREVRYHREQEPYTGITMDRLARGLPANIRLVSNPEYADLVVRVRRTGFNMDFRVTDVDRKDKKYKKSRRYTGGQCGVHHRAYYTRVEERGEANAHYSVKFDTKGFETWRDDFRLRSTEKYKYGKDLTARTNCGIRPTHHLPSNGVEKLFAKAGPGYRHHVAEEIRREAAENLGNKLAHQIKHSANRYYAHTAHRGHGGHGEYYENRYEYKDKKPDWVSIVARIVID